MVFVDNILLHMPFQCIVCKWCIFTIYSLSVFMHSRDDILAKAKKKPGETFSASGISNVQIAKLDYKQCSVLKFCNLTNSQMC